MRAKKLLSLLLVCVMLVGLFPASVFATSYGDTQGHWAQAAIDRWSDYGIVTGDGQGFRPNDNMTRAEAATVFSRLFGLSDAAAKTAFTDVAANDWFYEAVNKCVNAGIMNGVGDNQMNPNGTMTREMFFVMFARALGIKEQSTTKGLPADGDNWANGYINALTDKGFVQGMDGKVNALANINRASVMALLDQTIKQYVNASGTTTLSADKGVVLVNAKNVTLTGTTAADIVIAQGADGGNVDFVKATVTGAVTAQAANATITSDKDSKITTPVINGTNTTYTAAGAATSGGSGSGGGSGSSSGGGDSGAPGETIDPGALTKIASQEDVTTEKMAAYTNVTGSGTSGDPYIVTGNVEITKDLADGNLTLSNTQFTGNLTVAGGGSNSIILQDVIITGSLIFNKVIEGEMPHVKATGEKTSVGLGVQVSGGSKGAKLSVADVGGGKNDKAFKQITSAADVLLTGSATLDKVTVSGSGINVTADTDAAMTAVEVTGGSASITSTKAITKIDTAGSVTINATAGVGTVTSTGSNTAVAVESGTISSVVVESGSTTISATSGTVNAVEAQADVKLETNVATVTVPDTKADGTAVAGVDITVDKGAKITNASVGANGATITAGANGGSVTAVTASGSVALASVPVTTLAVNEGTTATVTLSGTAAVTTLDAAGDTTIAAVSGSTGSVGTLNAKGGDVTVSGGTVEKIAVASDNSTATTITVSGGAVAEVDAQAQTTVTGTSGTVGNVIASAESCSVDAAVVDQVTVNSSTGSTLTVANSTGSGSLAIDAKNAEALNIVAGTNANGTASSIDNVSISAKSDTGSAGTISVAKSDGSVATVTVKTKSAAPTLAYASKTTVTVTAPESAATGTVRLYDAGGKLLATQSLSANTYTFTGVGVTKVYATYQAEGNDKAESDKSAAAEFAPLSFAYTTALDVPAALTTEPSYTGTVALSSILNGTNSTNATIEVTTSGSWLSVDDSTKKLTGTRPADTESAATTITVTATYAADNETASIRIPVGAIRFPASTAPSSVEFTSDKTYKTLTVTGSGFASNDTFTVYAGNATTARALASTAVVDSATQATITLASSPAADVYVLYKKTGNYNAAETLVGTNTYQAFALTDAGKHGVSDVELNLRGSNKTFTQVNFSSFIQGGASTTSGAQKYSYAISGAPGWMSLDRETGILTGATPVATDTTKVTVTVTDGAGQSFQFPFNVTVNDDTVYVTSVTVSGAKTQLVAGETLQLSTAVTPARADNKTVAWSISENSVNATVENGVVKIGAPTVSADTTVTVTATANGAASGETVTGTYTITVKKDAYTVSVTGGTNAITSGSADQTVPFTAVVKNNGVTVSSKDVKWSSSDSSIATINADTGVLTVPKDLKIKTGTAVVTVTAAFGETTGTARINVTRAPVAAPDAELFTGVAPSTFGGTDGYIALAANKTNEAALEYSTGATGSFNTLELGEKGTDFAAGTYYVRYAETTDGAAPSAAVAVKVPAYKASISAAVDHSVLVIPADNASSATATVTAKVFENGVEKTDAAVELTAKYGDAVIPAVANENVLYGGVTFSDGTLSVTSAVKQELTGKNVNTIAVLVTATYTSGDTTKSYNAVVAITLNGEISVQPTIKTQPTQTQELKYYKGANVSDEITVVADTVSNGTLSYEWFMTTAEPDASTGVAVGGTKVDSKLITTETSNQTTKVRPDSSVSGTYYYYAVVTNTGTSTSGGNTVTLPTSSVSSKAVKVTVIDVAEEAAKVIPATLHDTTIGGAAIADNDLYTAYTANGAVDKTNANQVNVSVSADNLKMHANGAPDGLRAYWVGVGVPQVKGTSGTVLSVTYATGWSKQDVDEAASEAADGHMTKDGVTYDTFYFGALSSFSGKTGYIKATYTIGEPSETVVVYFVLDFSGVTLAAKDTDYTVNVTYTQKATGEVKTLTAKGDDSSPAAITGLKVGDVTTAVTVTNVKDSSFAKLVGKTATYYLSAAYTVGSNTTVTPYGTVQYNAETGAYDVTITGAAGVAGYAGTATIFTTNDAKSTYPTEYDESSALKLATVTVGSIDLEALASVIPATLFDNASSNPLSTLYTSYQTKGEVSTTKNQIDVTVTAADLMPHENAANTTAYWVGVGIPQVEGATYATGWSEANVKAATAEAADSHMEKDGKTYDTFYFGSYSGDFTDKTGYIKMTFGSETVIYKIDLSGVKTTQVGIGAVAATLHDNATVNAIADTDLVTDYTATCGQAAYDGKTAAATITVTAKDLQPHLNANQLNAYWIGVGIPQPGEGFSVTYQSGWVNELGEAAAADGQMTKDGVTYDTFYFGTYSGFTKDGVIKAVYTRGDDDEFLTVTYTIDLVNDQNTMVDTITFAKPEIIGAPSVNNGESEVLLTPTVEVSSAALAKTEGYAGKVLLVNATVTAGDALTAHYNGNGDYDYWIGVGIPQLVGAQYACKTVHVGDNTDNLALLSRSGDQDRVYRNADNKLTENSKTYDTLYFAYNPDKTANTGCVIVRLGTEDNYTYVVYNLTFEVTAASASLNKVLADNASEENPGTVTLSLKEGANNAYIATTADGKTFPVTVDNEVVIPAGAKLVVENADTYAALNDRVVKINAGGELYIGEQPVFFKADTNATNGGTELTEGAVVLELENKIVQFQPDAEATIYGWPDNWIAEIMHRAKVTLISEDAVANMNADKHICVRAGGELYVGEEPAVTAADNGNGIYLASGEVVLVPGHANEENGAKKLLVFQPNGDNENKNAVATVYGWNEGWHAIVQRSSTILVPSQERAAALLSSLSADFSADSKLGIGTQDNYYLILGPEGAEKQGDHYLAMQSLSQNSSSIFVGDGVVVIFENATIPEGKTWTTNWGGENDYRVELQENATLTVNGTMYVTGELVAIDGKLAGTGTVILNSDDAIVVAKEKVKERLALGTEVSAGSILGEDITTHQSADEPWTEYYYSVVPQVVTKIIPANIATPETYHQVISEGFELEPDSAYSYFGEEDGKAYTEYGVHGTFHVGNIAKHATSSGEAEPSWWVGVAIPQEVITSVFGSAASVQVYTGYTLPDESSYFGSVENKLNLQEGSYMVQDHESEKYYTHYFNAVKASANKEPCFIVLRADDNDSVKMVSYVIEFEATASGTTDATVIPATLHDNAEVGFADEELYKADSYKTVGTVDSTDKSKVNVEVSIEDLLPHENANGLTAYWVGVGIPHTSGATYQTGWDLEKLGDAEATDSHMEQDGLTYDTFYFGTYSGDFTGKTGYIVANYGNNTKITYELDFTGVKTKKVEIDAIPATLHDNAEGGFADDALYGTYNTGRGTATYGDKTAAVTVTVSASDLQKHENANHLSAYWVGVGIPQPGEGFTVTYQSGWADGELGEAEAAGSWMEQDGKKYDTFYFGSTSGNFNKNGVVKAIYRYDGKVVLTVTYTVEFSVVVKDTSGVLTPTTVYAPQEAKLTNFTARFVSGDQAGSIGGQTIAGTLYIACDVAEDVHFVKWTAPTDAKDKDAAEAKAKEWISNHSTANLQTNITSGKWEGMLPISENDANGTENALKCGGTPAILVYSLDNSGAFLEADVISVTIPNE